MHPLLCEILVRVWVASVTSLFLEVSLERYAVGR